MDKLTCPRRDPPNSSVPSTSQVVLLGCGSYNPPTSMHLRMFEIGKDALQQVRFMSPIRPLTLHPIHPYIRLYNKESYASYVY